MRKIKAILLIGALAAAMVQYITNYNTIMLTEASIVSYTIGDADGDGLEELIALVSPATYTGIEGKMTYGQTLVICCYDPDKQNIYGRYKPIYTFDLSEIKPMKVMLGDVDGDGVNEISLMVYKQTKFHPIEAIRPFIYKYIDYNLQPFWLGSRLSRPFMDYILFDIDGDSIDEIVAAEYIADGKMVVCAYSWEGFGFDKIAESLAYDEILSLSKTNQVCTIDVLNNGIVSSHQIKYKNEGLLE